MNTRRYFTIEEIRKGLLDELPEGFFSKRSPTRVLYLLSAYTALFLHLYVTVRFVDGQLGWFYYVLTLIISTNFLTFCFFFLHEALHGSVFKNKKLVFITSFLGGIFFLVAPSIWRKWHNHHHLHTAMPCDYDRFPAPELDPELANASIVGKIQHLPKIISFFNPFFYLSAITVIPGSHLMVYVENLIFENELKFNLKPITFEYALVIACFFAPLIFLPGKLAFLGFYLPVGVANIICGFYIITNHNDSDLTLEKNYILNTSLSVFFSRKLNVTHMQFGRHVEHHIFPGVSHDKLRVVTCLLRKKYPNEFKEKNFFSAMCSILTKKRYQRVIGINKKDKVRERS